MTLESFCLKWNLPEECEWDDVYALLIHCWEKNFVLKVAQRASHFHPNFKFCTQCTPQGSLWEFISNRIWNVLLPKIWRFNYANSARRYLCTPFAGIHLHPICCAFYNHRSSTHHEYVSKMNRHISLIQTMVSHFPYSNTAIMGSKFPLGGWLSISSLHC